MAESEGPDTTTEARTVPVSNHQPEPKVSVDPSNWVPRNKYTEVKRQLEALQSQVAAFDTERADWQQERAMMGAGLLDESARAVAKALHGTLPEADRPPLVDWVAAMKADPEQAHPSLRPFLGAQQLEQAAAPAATPQRTTRQQPPAPETGATASLEAIKAAKEHGRKTGDWSRFNELSKLARDSAVR